MKDPSNKDWLHLSGDEQVVRWEHPSLIPSLPPIIGGILIAFAGLFAFVLMDLGPTMMQRAPLILVAVGLLMAGLEYLDRLCTHYVLTDNKVVKKWGIVRMDKDEVNYDDISSMNDNQSIIERVFSFGDIDIMSSGTSGVEMTLENVGSFTEYSRLLTKFADENTVRAVMENAAAGKSDEDNAGNTDDGGDGSDDSSDDSSGNSDSVDVNSGDEAENNEKAGRVDDSESNSNNE